MEEIFEQSHAVELAMTDYPLFSITGPAGTGKSSVIRKFFERYMWNNKTTPEYTYPTIGNSLVKNVSLVAPTGKAVKSAKERTGLQNIKTIHQLLEFPDPDQMKINSEGKPVSYDSEGNEVPYGPARNRHNPLDTDVIVIDEASMVGWTLLDQITDALPEGAVIRAFGDINQLKPVEEDDANRNRVSPFQYMLNKHPSITLQHIWRSGSNIYDNSFRILSSKKPIQNDGFFILDNDNVIEDLTDWVYNCGIDYISSPENQIITPSNKGDVGTDALNKFFLERMEEQDPTGWFYLLRSKFDPNPNIKFKLGMKVLQTKNDYNLGVMNGETGIINFYSPKDGSVSVDFGDRMVAYPKVNEDAYNYLLKFPQMNLQPGVVITTHKSQGSQYDNIVYVMRGDTRGLLGRSNFYTGVTRAKYTCTVITDQKALNNSLRFD